MCATLWLLATNRIEGNSLTTVIPVMSADVRQPTTIIIRRASGSLTSRSNLDGFAGLMHRARAAYDQLSNDFPSTGAVPDAVTILMQTGNRIGYRPETAKTEISALSTQTSAAVLAVHRPSRPLSRGAFDRLSYQSVFYKQARKPATRSGHAFLVSKQRNTFHRRFLNCEVELYLFMPLRMLLTPQLQQQRRHCRQHRFCPVNLGMTARAERKHQAHDRLARHPVVNDDGAFVATGGIAHAAAIAVTLQNRFTQSTEYSSSCRFSV